MKRPLEKINMDLKANPLSWAGLVTSLPEEHDYICKVEGQLPELHGRLYRLGPGLYDRGDQRKRMVLDGDGMMQEFHFQGQKVSYRNRFIRTKKFVAEAKANRFMYPTLSTHSSGSWFENLGINLPHQANITPLAVDGYVLAFDESQRPYKLNQKTLETLSEIDLDEMQPQLRYWAHYKIDSKNKLFHFLSVQQGPVLKLQIISTDLNLKVVQRQKFNLPRASYFHDWFFTDQYFGFILHPAIVSLKTLLSVSLGFDTFSDALKWQPSKGNIVCLVNRSTGQLQSFETESCWMWHSVNAYDQGDDVLVDFIGSEEGGGLGDENSPLFAIMKNQDVPMPMQTTNHLRRYHIKPQQKTIKYETLDQSGNFELPTVSAFERGQKQSYAHFIHAKPGEFFARGLSEWNYSKQSLSTYFSPGNEYFSEPLDFSTMAKPSPFVSSLVYSGDVQKSYLAIFKVGCFSDGPVAKVWLNHHAPLGFHGYWQG